MGFNPFQEKGTPVEKQISNWSQLNVQPYNKLEVHPYTRTRIILMNGIEVESVFFLHQFHRHTADIELKQKLALARRVEQQQQKMINWLSPADESTLEMTLGYEQVAVDLTACLAKAEPDPNVKSALDFALIEDFDHLYRYANLYEMAEKGDAERVVGDFTEVFPGRPTALEHRHPLDSIRKSYDKNKADILTKLHVATIVAGEQQTMNFYMNVGNRPGQMVGRGLYQEIAQIEEQHVTHYGSLADASMTWFEQLLLHEYNECYLYYSCYESETDSRIKEIWKRNLDDEITHLKMAAELMKMYEKRDPEALFPDQFPALTIFKSNKDYVRTILHDQINLTTYGTEYVNSNNLPKDNRYEQYQNLVNSNSVVPSQKVIEDHISQFGTDYRFESQGPHPVEWLRDRKKVVPWNQTK